MQPNSEQSKPSRRGCTAFAVLSSLIVILLIAISLGWLGQIDKKNSDLPVVGGS